MVSTTTVSSADLVCPPEVPEIVTAVVAATGLVGMVKLALFAPAVTVTLGGTTAIVPSLLASVMTTPPTGAAPLRITLPNEELPPITLEGFNVRDESDGAAGVGAGVAMGVAVGVGVGVDPISPIFTTKASS